MVGLHFASSVVGLLDDQTDMHFTVSYLGYRVIFLIRPWSVDSLDGGSTDAMKIPPIEK